MFDKRRKTRSPWRNHVFWYLRQTPLAVLNPLLDFLKPAIVASKTPSRSLAIVPLFSWAIVSSITKKAINSDIISAKEIIHSGDFSPASSATAVCFSFLSALFKQCYFQYSHGLVICLRCCRPRPDTASVFGNAFFAQIFDYCDGPVNPRVGTISRPYFADCDSTRNFA